MAQEHETALERQEEVLSDCLDSLEPPPVELLGHSSRGRPRMRGLDLDLLADERLEAPRGTVDRIALGHGRIVPFSRKSPAGRRVGRNALA
jgi:hypothetical protein